VSRAESSANAGKSREFRIAMTAVVEPVKLARMIAALDCRRHRLTAHGAPLPETLISELRKLF
jgi:hypothetical protein